MVNYVLRIQAIDSMFEFLFKRSKPRSPSTAQTPLAPAAVPSALPQPSQRQLAMEQAALLGDDEAAAVAFIRSCNVAEARLLAAQKIHTRASLEQVQKAMRDTDRRVARLMQQQLAALSAQEATQRRAQGLLDQAHALLAEPALRANQVVELERAWQAIGAPATESLTQFDHLRLALHARLQAQAGLQRRLLDTIASLRGLLLDTGADWSTIEQAGRDLDAMLEVVRQDAELAGLPRQLLPELLGLHEQLQQVAGQREAERALAAALPASDAPPAAGSGAIAELATQQAAPTPQADAGENTEARTEPADLAGPPAVPGTPAEPAEPAEHERRRPARERQAKPANVESAADASQRRTQFTAALEGLQAALAEGALQRAMEQARMLRSFDEEGLRLAPERRAALAAARAELARLQGWARWGTSVSREELLAAVEALPQQDLALPELAKKVGSMRERWIALDASSGAAPRAAWLRFDAACTAAYAPVAAHHAALATTRAENAVKAQSLLEEVVEFARQAGVADIDSATGSTTADWRGIAQFCQRMRQAWQRLGPLDRKEQKRLDAAFARAMQPLHAPLETQQALEIILREKLIAEVAVLSPQARETLERVQALQARWQEQARAFPLPRQAEQALWERFRGACDAIFAQRKLAGMAADAQRADNLQAREALCSALEASLADPAATDAQRASLLREVRAKWDAAGQVPRQAHAALQSRFDAAVQALQSAQLVRQRDTARQYASAVLQRLQLCESAESQFLQNTHDAVPVTQLRAQWHALPPVSADMDQVLGARFDAAIDALEKADTAYADRLQRNQAERDVLLLGLEIAGGLESPPAYRRERLELKVQGLKSTLENGGAANQAAAVRAQFIRLCGMPAVADEQARQRTVRVVETMLSSGG